MVDVDPSFTPGSTDAVGALYETALDCNPNCVPQCPEAVAQHDNAITRIGEVPTFQRVADICGNDDRSAEAADKALQRAKDAVTESRLATAGCPGPIVLQIAGYTITLCADKDKRLFGERLHIARPQRSDLP